LPHKCSASAKFVLPSYLLITCLSIVVEFLIGYSPPLAIKTFHLIKKLKSEWLMAVKFHVLMKYLMLFGGYRVTPFRTHSKSSLLAVMT